MTSRRSDGATVRQLRGLFSTESTRSFTDGQLLERCATARDEVAELAFATLVERHEAIVWRVCWAVLRDQHQAEDAFQATFLVLVRKSRSLWVQASLGPWLHQVAYRTACGLRRSIRRQRKHELRYAERDASRLVADVPLRDLDLDAAVHAEIDRLPDKYRVVVVLCDLEGRTHQDAAYALGWPIGTVKSRQSRGRSLLRDGLIHRGLRLAVATALVGTPGQAGAGAVPAGLVRRIIRMALRRSAEATASWGVSQRVLVLTQGALRTMVWNQLRSLAAALMVGISASATGVYVLGSQASPSQGGPATSVSPSTSTTAPLPPAASSLPIELRAQQLATRRARIAADIARSRRELAEVAVEEFEAVTFPEWLAAANGEIALARSELTRTEDRLAWSQHMLEQRSISRAVIIRDELAVERARFEVEQAETQRDVLTKYTRDKKLKSFQTEVAKAQSEETTKHSAWVHEQGEETALRRLIHPEPSGSIPDGNPKGPR